MSAGLLISIISGVAVVMFLVYVYVSRQKPKK